MRSLLLVFLLAALLLGAFRVGKRVGYDSAIGESARKAGPLPSPWSFYPDKGPSTPPTEDQVLLTFCEQAYLVDRGVVNSLFAGTTDSWIVNYLMSDATFCSAPNITPEQVAAVRSTISFALEPKIDMEEATTEVDRFQRAEPTLASVLTVEQQEKLPLVYLNIEGLAALRRKEFRELVGLTLNEQKKIADTYDKEATYGGRANVGHRGLFTLRNNQLHYAPSVAIGLRIISVQVDHRILDLLTAEQQSKLVPIIKQAQTLWRIVEAPGAWAPRQWYPTAE